MWAQIWDVLWKVLVTGIGAAFIGSIIFFIKWLISLSTILKDMQTNGKARKEEMTTTLSILKKLIVTVTGILQTIKDGNVNGNITRGFTCMDEADKLYDNLLFDKVKGE